MLKKIALVAVLATVSLGAAGCFVQGPGGTVTPIPLPPATTPIGQQAAEVIGKVQDTSTKICKFVPTAQTVASILATFAGSTVASVNAVVFDVANQICAAVSGGAQARRASAPPTVRGVPIRGQFVR